MSPNELRAWRHRNRLTQGEAARIFRVHPITMAKWEAGMQGMAGPAARLAQLLDNPAIYTLAHSLVNDQGEKK